MPWLKLHEDVHIASGAEIIAQNGTEQRKAPNPVPAAKLLDFICWYIKFVLTWIHLILKN